MAANFNLRFSEDVPEEGRKATIVQAEALIQSLLHDESEKRRAVSIISSLGGDFMFHFFDPKTTEMILNPDGTLWHEKLASPMTKFGRLDKFDAKKVLGLVADYSGKTVDANSPMLSANFPLVQLANPAVQVGEAFYRLTFYDSLAPFAGSLATLVAISAVLFAVAALFMRRQRYAYL